MKRYILPIISLLFVAHNLSASPYYGSFNWGVTQLDAFRFSNFSSTSSRSSYGHTLTWNSVPSYVAVMMTATAYPADFAITTGSSLSAFLNYNTYQYYERILSGYGVITIRPSATSYGFGARDQQQVTNRRNVDSFKSYAYSVHYLPDYVSGRDPVTNVFSNTAWVRGGRLTSGNRALSLIENPTSSQDRRSVHSFSIPSQSSAANTVRYVWYSFSQLSASASSGVFIIPASSYNSFMAGSSFTYFHTSTNSPTELLLPAGSYYVVVVNAQNVNTIHAGSVTSQIYTYTRASRSTGGNSGGGGNGGGNAGGGENNGGGGAGAPEVSPNQALIDSLQLRITQIRKRVKNPVARAAQIRRLNAMIMRLKATA